MSNVTNAILTHGWEPQAMEELRSAMTRAEIFRGMFTQVDQHAAGPKGMEASIHIAGFNHLDEPALIETIRGIAWESPEFVQLFLKRQDDVGFTEVKLFRSREPIRQRKLAAGRGMGLTGPQEQHRFHENFPRLMEEFYGKTRLDEQNPLRPTPWRQKIAETNAQADWIFEVLCIRPEYFFKSGTRVASNGLDTKNIGCAERTWSTVARRRS